MWNTCVCVCVSVWVSVDTIYSISANDNCVHFDGCYLFGGIIFARYAKSRGKYVLYLQQRWWFCIFIVRNIINKWFCLFLADEIIQRYIWHRLKNWRGFRRANNHPNSRKSKGSQRERHLARPAMAQPFEVIEERVRTGFHSSVLASRSKNQVGG